MGRLTPETRVLEPAVLTEPQILERLRDWSERLVEAKDGRSNCVLTSGEIRRELDRLLDNLILFLAAREL